MTTVIEALLTGSSPWVILVLMLCGGISTLFLLFRSQLKREQDLTDELKKSLELQVENTAKLAQSVEGLPQTLREMNERLLRISWQVGLDGDRRPAP